MAKKTRKTNTAVSAIAGLVATIGKVAEIELAGNPEAIADVKKMTADLTDSNLTTAMENLDDQIETQHQVEEILDGAGLDLTEINRENAVAGAITMANAVEVEPIAEPIDTE
jgi:hypothetical protein